MKFLLLLLLTITGCGNDSSGNSNKSPQTATATPEPVATYTPKPKPVVKTKMRKGLTKAQVLESFGEPQSTSPMGDWVYYYTYCPGTWCSVEFNTETNLVTRFQGFAGEYVDLGI